MTIRQEKVEVDLQYTLIKDLQEDEVICSTCKGSGIVIDNNPFGIKGENTLIRFPYKKQSIRFCPNCYTGVQKKCEDCSKLLGRNYICDCDKTKEKQSEIREQKRKDIHEKAEKITLKELMEQGYENMFYVDNDDSYYSEIEYLLDEYEGNIDGLRIYETIEDHVTFDADNVIENVTEDLPEETRDNAFSYVKELQELLDTLAAKMKGSTTTYYPNFKRAIININS